MLKTRFLSSVVVSLSMFAVAVSALAEEETGTSAVPYIEGKPKPPKAPGAAKPPFGSIGKVSAALAGNPPAGYTRIQLKNGGQFLDAAYCGKTITLNPGSDFDGGACQLWRFVPAGGGYFRIQLKNGGQFLDAAYCGKTITLNPGSDFDGGACQLWRVVPGDGGYFRIQLKNGGQFLDAAYCGKTITLNPGSTYDGGSCQLWRWAR